MKGRHGIPILRSSDVPFANHQAPTVIDPPTVATARASTIKQACKASPILPDGWTVKRIGYVFSRGELFRFFDEAGNKIGQETGANQTKATIHFLARRTR